MTTDFERATAVVEVTPQRYRAELSRDWWVRSAPNGGYCAAIMLRSLLASEVDHALIPRSLHLQFMAPPESGAVEIVVRAVRRTRSLSIVDAVMIQSGQELLRATVTSSRPRAGIGFDDLPMPGVAPARQCPRVESWVPVNERCELRRAFGSSAPGERALTGGWIRLRQPPPFEAVTLAFLWDAWIPAPLMRTLESPCRGHIVTLEASLYFKRCLRGSAIGSEDSLLLRVESTTAESGFVEESGELWSPSGELLVQSRQLSLLV